MTGDRAMRVAIAAGEQVAANPALAVAQQKAWARFIRIVWAGPAVRDVPSLCCAYDDRDPLGMCRRCGERVPEGAS
jgi:hypothetical protein